MTSSWFFLSTLNYDARSTTHQISHSLCVLTCMFSPLLPVCDGLYCGQGAQCIATASGPTCACVEGFIGNPFPGGHCVPDICSSSNPCVEPSVCIGGRCKERCEGVICGVGATCDKNTNLCVCEPFFIGNPDLICMPRKCRAYYFLAFGIMKTHEVHDQ